MRKVDEIHTSDTTQNFSGSFMKCAPAAIMVRLKRHSLKKSPDVLSDIEVWRISGEVEDVKSPFSPPRDFLCDFPFYDESRHC